MALGVRPPMLIGHGGKETMKTRRNGKKWQQKPGERSQKKWGLIRGPGLTRSTCLSDSHTLRTGEESHSDWQKD
jgi:hypothetical protein